jgi:hypothetical protein
MISFGVNTKIKNTSIIVIFMNLLIDKPNQVKKISGLSLKGGILGNIKIFMLFT